MRQISTRTRLLLLFAWIALASASARTQDVADNESLLAWLRANSSPLASLNPGADFSDLQPLKDALTGVRVVGLGEATHGTHEFFLLKHRLLRFLITELGFTAFALEAGSADIEPLDEYVVRGTGDLATALTEQGYTCWDTEEMTATIDWIRSYNTHVPDARKVRIIGLDIGFNPRGRARVLAYLRTHAPQRLAETETVFRTLSEVEAGFPFNWPRERAAATRGQVEALRDFLIAEKVRLGPGSAGELDPVIRDIQRTVQQTLWAAPAGTPGRRGRPEAMADNLLELIKNRPETKFIVSAFNGHTAVRGPGGQVNIGSELRALLGPAYFNIGLEFGKGSSQMRRGDAQGTLGAFEEVAMPAPPAGSLPWFLAQVRGGDFFVNLRAPRSPSIDQWLARPIPAHALGWAHRPGEVQTMTDGAVGRYDGLLFVATTSRARPTKNALATVARRGGF